MISTFLTGELIPCTCQLLLVLWLTLLAHQARRETWHVLLKPTHPHNIKGTIVVHVQHLYHTGELEVLDFIFFSSCMKHMSKEAS